MKDDSAATVESDHGHSHDHDHSKDHHGHDHHDPDHGQCGHEHGEKHDEVGEQDQATDQSFFFYLKVLALFVWGGVLIYFYASGRVNHFLSGDGLFRVQTAIAGMGLFVLGLFNIFYRKAKVDCGHDHSHSHAHEHTDGGTCCGHDHDHGHDDAGSHDDGHEHHHEDRTIAGQLTMLIILLLPVTAAAMMTPDNYSNAFKKARLASAITDPEKAVLPDSFDIRKQAAETEVATADAAGTQAAPKKTGGLPEFTIEDLEGIVKRSDEGNFMISLIELFYSAGDVEVRNVLKGQNVETIAQVVDDTLNNPNGTRLRGFRMFMQCCAADSRPVSIALEFNKASPQFKEMGWYKIIGTMDFQKENGIVTPILEVRELREDKEPSIRIQ